MNPGIALAGALVQASLWAAVAHLLFLRARLPALLERRLLRASLVGIPLVLVGSLLLQGVGWTVGGGLPRPVRLGPGGAVGSDAPVRRPLPEPSHASASMGPRPATPRFSFGRFLLGALLAVWGAGAMVHLARGAVARGRMRAWQRLARPGGRSDLLRCALLARRLGVARRFEVVRHPSLRAPAAWGVFRMTLGLPVPGDSVPGDPPDPLLAHELGHLAGRDPAWQMFGRAVASALWWHPSVGWLARRSREVAEVACDDLAASLEGAPSYAAELVEAAGRAVHGLDAWTPAALSLLGGETSLERRIDMLLDETRVRRTCLSGWERRAGLLAIGVALAVCAGFAPLAPAQEPVAPVAARERSTGEDPVLADPLSRGEAGLRRGDFVAAREQALEMQARLVHAARELEQRAAALQERLVQAQERMERARLEAELDATLEESRAVQEARVRCGRILAEAEERDLQRTQPLPPDPTSSVREEEDRREEAAREEMLRTRQLERENALLRAQIEELRMELRAGGMSSSAPGSVAGMQQQIDDLRRMVEELRAQIAAGRGTSH